MKKMLLLLALLLFLCSLASAADVPGYVGTWALSTEFMEGKYDLTILQVNQDHSLFFSSQWFFTGQEKPGLDNKYVAQWSAIDDHSFRMEDSSGLYSGEFVLESENRLVDDSGLVYSRIGAIPVTDFKAVTEQEEKKKADLDPVGKWSFYWDARELNRLLGADRMSFDIQSYDLFLLDNGAAYMQKASVKNGKEDFSADMLSGIWLGDASDLTIRVGELTYKAWIDASGRLFWKTTDQMAMIFNRTDFYNYEEGFLE